MPLKSPKNPSDSMQRNPDLPKLPKKTFVIPLKPAENALVLPEMPPTSLLNPL